MSNPFHEAIQPGPPPPTHTVDHPHFFQHVHEQEKLKQQARNMTRQQLFDNGFLTVEDLDDEELRLGRCRDAHGRIPKVTKTMEMVPRDLYDEMVAEHLHRTKEKFRQQLDLALNTMVEVMTDPTCEPKDRTDAAKYLIERTMGKSVERVAVSVSKEPWEELLGDVAHITRAQHMALKQGAIDAEVVETVEDSGPEYSGAQGNAVVPQGVSPVHAAEQGAPDGHSGSESGRRPDVDARAPQVPGAVDGVRVLPSSAATPVEATRVHGDQAAQEQADMGYVTRGDAWAPNPMAPTHDNLATSNPVGPKSLSEQLREAQAEQQRIAEARQARRKLVQDAKKRRLAARATGSDVLRRNIDAEAFAKVQERLVDTKSWPPEDGEAG